MNSQNYHPPGVPYGGQPMPGMPPGMGRPPGVGVGLPPGMPPPYGHPQAGMMRPPGMVPPIPGGMMPAPYPHPPVPGPSGLLRPPIARPATHIFAAPPSVVLPKPVGLPPPRPLAAPANLTSQVQAHLQSKLRAASMPDKSTTLYVGKIALSVEDSVIRSLLEACGPVKSWKPVQDPETQKSKGYGFCEFEEAEGVLHALQYLNKLSLDGQELMLKCTTATQNYVDAYQLKKEAEIKARKLEKKEREKKAVEDGEVEQQAEEEQTEEELEDQKILEKVMTIVSARATEQTVSKADSTAAASDFLANLEEDKQLPPPPGRPTGKRPREEAGAQPDYERKIEDDYRRERDREREDEELRMKERDRQYKDRLHAWERYERERKAEQEKEKEREKDLFRERQRHMRADLEADDDIDEPQWRRASYSHSRRAEDRRRRRISEEQADEADRLAEQEEMAAKRQRGEVSDEGSVGSEGEAYPAANGQASEGVTRALEVEVDPEDPIYQAMIAAAKAPPPVQPPIVKEPPIAVVAPPQARQAPIDRLSPPRPEARQEAGQPGRSRQNVLSVFGGDDDDDKPARKLIPLEYTEAELKAIKQQSKPQDSQTVLKKLVKEIPTDWEGVSKYPVKWKAYAEGFATMGPKLRSWVKKKTGELLGEEEASMVDFVMSHLKDEGSAKKMLASLSPVLDNEAEPFVTRLYRMLIYETLKYSLGLSE